MSKIKTSKIAAAARKFLAAQDKGKQAATEKKAAQTSVIEEMGKTPQVVVDGLKVTVVTPSSMVYDDQAIYDEMKPSQRKACFVRSYDLNALTVERQNEIMKEIGKLLTRTERPLVEKNRLDEDRLVAAISEKKVDPKMIARHATEVEKASYIRVTTAGE